MKQILYSDEEVESLRRYSNLGTGWTPEESWLDFLQGQEIYLFSKASRQVLGHIQHPIYWVPGAPLPG